jgi:hypothetical protein
VHPSANAHLQLAARAHPSANTYLQNTRLLNIHPFSHQFLNTAYPTTNQQTKASRPPPLHVKTKKTQTTLPVRINMASMISLQRGEKLTLHATFPPTLPGRVCDWTITSIVGELPGVDPVEYTQWLEMLPGRIETVSVLNTLLFPHLVKGLLLSWILGLWCRLQSRAAVHDKIQVRERYLVDAGFVVAGLLLASNERLKSCVLLLAG